MSKGQTAKTPQVAALRSGEAAIAVWGCGHIGASGMYYFARAGVRCVGYDIAAQRVAEVLEGRFLSTDGVLAYRLEQPKVPVAATTDWRELAAYRPVVHVVSVPTERGAEPSSAALQDVMPLICESIRSTDLGDLTPIVIIESTIQPSWIDTVVTPALHAGGLRPGVDVLVGAAPRRDWFSGSEYNLESLPRIVGGSTSEATEVLTDLYSIVCRDVVPARDAYHAAFTKVIENLIRFQGLTLANSLALAFPQYDMTHVFRLASTKWNIPLFHPSLGVGGHCIPLAPQYTLAEGGDSNNYLSPVRDAVTLNDNYFSTLYRERLKALLGDCRSIGILGLAYTADAKMHKLSPALDAVDCLKDTPRLRLHDPYYTAEDIDDLCGVATLNFPDDLAGCDGIVLVTAHTPYLHTRVEDHIRPGTIIVDNFGAWRDRDFAPGVHYHEVGRPYTEDSRSAVRSAEPSSALTD
ncbi:MAG TPA: UDP binding domain-containing protein [Chloroflexota bacterium]|nr:UDP binding domain-containing protein [Chloroflexota bacterium]